MEVLSYETYTATGGQWYAPLDDLTCNDTLFRIEETGWLIEEVD